MKAATRATRATRNSIGHDDKTLQDGRPLAETEHNYRLTFDGVTYLPTDHAAALGTLLYGLRPAGFTFDCKHDPRDFMKVVQATANVLHMAANGIAFDGSDEFTYDYHQQLVLLAVGLAPDEGVAERARRLIAENIRPDWPRRS